MKIIVVGAGQVGRTLTENLSSEANDITVIDNDYDRLTDFQQRLDIRTVHGEGSDPNVLRQAGAEEADMLIAVTTNDEFNMVVCQLAHSLFGVPRKIGRIRSPAFLAEKGLFHDDVIPIDVAINPESEVTDQVIRLIERPGALQVLDFAGGRVQMVAIKARYGGRLVGQELRFLRQHIPSVDSRVVAIFRRNNPILPTGTTVIEVDDEVFFIAARDDIPVVMRELRRNEKAYSRIMIAGGGHIGEQMGIILEQRYQVKIIERSLARCQQLSESLNKCIVLHGLASDQQLLLEENIEDTDIFCAMTNDDESNIMTSMLAKRLGVQKVITLINNPVYADLVQGGAIDIAISPQQITIGSLLTHVRRGDVVKVHSLRRGAAEAIEAVAHGDADSSKLIGVSIAAVPLPPNTTIGAIVRGNDVLIAHDDLVVQPEDHMIFFVTDKLQIAEVERLFQPA